MPRKYTKKRPGPSYTAEDLQMAVNDIKSHVRTYQQVEDFYGIPKAVVFHRIKGRKSSLKLGAGRPQALSAEAELDLENCIKAKARMGIPCSREEVIQITAEYVRLKNLQTPFRDGVPNNDWYYGFLKRHPSISFKKPELLQKNRQDARDPFVIYEFYNDLNQLIKDNDLNDKPEFVFNCDESGFCSDPKKFKALGEKGKALNRVSGGSGRESTTVLATISAAGKCLPPLIVFKGVAVQARHTSQNAYPGTLYTTSKNGWMEEPQFFEWFSSSFVEHVKNLRIEKELPNQGAILMFDGHGSHISYRIIKAAIDNNIHLVKFPSHLTDRLQPLDKCVFGPIKTRWEKKLIQFIKTQIELRQSAHLSKARFVELLGEVWMEAMKPHNIVMGFQSTGTFPVDKTKFPESEFNPSSLKRYKEMLEQSIPITSSSSTDSAARATTVQESLASTSTVTTPQGITEQHLHSSESAAQAATVQENTLTTTIPQDTDPRQHLITPEKVPSPYRKIVTPTGIIGLFYGKLSTNKDIEKTGVKRQIVPRLKPIKYGEILTTEAVLKKQQEAEMLKKQKKQPKQVKRKCVDEGSDKEESNNEESLCKDSSSDEENLAEVIALETTPEVNYESPNWNSLIPGKFVLVDFLGGSRNKNHYKYVCCIREKNDEDGDIIVQGYRRHDRASTEFIYQDNDISTISLQMVEAILPDPSIKMDGRKMVYTFPGSVAVFEK